MAAHRMSGKAGTAPETGSGVIPGAIPEQRELRFVGVERLREAVLEGAIGDAVLERAARRLGTDRKAFRR